MTTALDRVSHLFEPIGQLSTRPVYREPSLASVTRRCEDDRTLYDLLRVFRDSGSRFIAAFYDAGPFTGIRVTFGTDRSLQTLAFSSEPSRFRSSVEIGDRRSKTDRRAIMEVIVCTDERGPRNGDRIGNTLQLELNSR